MRNSPLLKWAQNNKNNKLNNAKNKGEDKGGNNKNWIHSPETLLNGHVVYLVKFLGDIEVDQPKGIEVVKQGIQKLKFNQQLKKAEGGGNKTPKAELTISVDGVTIQEPKSKKVMHEYPLHKISYCADDKAEKRFFSFIAKEGDSQRHTCFVFVSDKLAEEITLTIGQAFGLAYKKFLDTSGKDKEMSKQIMIFQKRVTVLENENAELKKRLTAVAAIKGTSDIQQYLKDNNLADLCHVEDPVGTAAVLSSGRSASDEDDEDDDDDDTLDDDNGNNVMKAVASSNELICLEEATALSTDHLDSYTLDALNDDDFNPRAADTEEHLAAAEVVVLPPLPQPPALPPRDKKSVNPFESTVVDPFGMAAFDAAPPIAKTTSSPVAATTTDPSNFTLDMLDPLKN